MPFAGQGQKEFQLIDQGRNLRTGADLNIDRLIENFNRLMAVGGLFLIDKSRSSGVQKDSSMDARTDDQAPGSGRRNRPRRTPKGRQVDPKALDEVSALLGDRSRRRDLLIEHLHLIQDEYGHLSAAHLAALALEMKLALTEVYEVATFYAHFDVVKEGEFPPPPVTVRVCDSLSCAMAGAEGLLARLPDLLGK